MFCPIGDDSQQDFFIMALGVIYWRLEALGQRPHFSDKTVFYKKKRLLSKIDAFFLTYILNIKLFSYAVHCLFLAISNKGLVYA